MCQPAVSFTRHTLKDRDRVRREATAHTIRVFMVDADAKVSRAEVKRNWVVLYYPALHERRLSIGAVPINCRMSVLAVTVTVVSLYPAEEDLRRWLSVDVRRDEREEKGNPHPLVVFGLPLTSAAAQHSTVDATSE